MSQTSNPVESLRLLPQQGVTTDPAEPIDEASVSLSELGQAVAPPRTIPRPPGNEPTHLLARWVMRYH